MNRSDHRILKFRYKMLPAGAVIVAVAISVYPTLQFASWFANYLHYDMLGPVKENSSGLVWLLGFFVVGMIDIAAGYILVLFLLCKRNKWDANQAKNYFMRSRYPKHWYKEA